jgi:hypothetical protein
MKRGTHYSSSNISSEGHLASFAELVSPSPVLKKPTKKETKQHDAHLAGITNGKNETCQQLPVAVHAYAESASSGMEEGLYKNTTW